MNRPLRILLVEDNVATLDALARLITQKNPSITLGKAECLKVALERIKKGGIDVILLDLTLPDAAGSEACIKLRAEAPNIPIVVYTGADKSLDLECLKAGAEDFIRKGSVDDEELVRAIRYAVIRNEVRFMYAGVRSGIAEAKDIAVKARVQTEKIEEQLGTCD